jgi:acid phosphatase
VIAAALAATVMARAQTPAPVDPRLGCNAAPAVPPPDLSEPDNIDFFKKRLLYYRCTAYEDDIAKVLGDAQKWVAARAPQVQHPAIVLDIDETSLLNWPRIYQDDYAYFPSFPNVACDFTKVGDPCGDLDWQQSGLATAVVPTLDLYKFARCIDQPSPCTKIDVFFVTGRREQAHNQEMPSVWTLRNLNAAGFGAVERDRLYMRDPASTGSVTGHKSAARADIESKGFTIIANVGDQKSDLAGGHADMTFKVPNPFYFIP